MKSVAGREFAKALEQRGWELLRVQGTIIFTARKAALFGSLFRYMVPSL